MPISAGSLSARFVQSPKVDETLGELHRHKLPEVASNPQAASARSMKRVRLLRLRTAMPRRATRHRVPAARRRAAKLYPEPRSRPRKRAMISPQLGAGPETRPRQLFGAICCHAFACEEADLTFTAGRTDQSGQRSCLAKASFPQHCFPLRAFQQRMLRAKISILKAPPAAGQTENGVRPELRRGNVNEQETASRREQFVNVPQAPRGRR